jgi:hypothetical protein
MSRLLTALMASCLAVWACSGNNDGGLFGGSNGTKASGGNTNGSGATGQSGNNSGATNSGGGTGGATGTPSGGTTGSPTGGTTGTPTGGTGTGGIATGGRATGGVATGGTGPCTGPGTPTGTITDQYGYYYVDRCGVRYVVQNNVWGSSAQQTLTYSGVSFKVTQQTGNNSTSGGPVSYPSVFIGSNNNRTTPNSGMPKQVSSLTTVPVTWSYATNGASGTYNASFDVWFSTSSAGDTGNPSGGYLMVWFYKPGNAQPVGGQVGSPESPTATLAGATFNVWYGSNGKPVTSYVYQNSVTSASFDLNLFIRDAVSRGHVQNSWYLTNIFAGFEIWSGGVGLQTLDFTATVN